MIKVSKLVEKIFIINILFFYQIVFKKLSRFIKTDFEFTRTALLFVHDEMMIKNEQNFEKVKTLLEELKTATESDIRENVPTLFSELVKEMKFLKYEQMTELMTMVKAFT